MPRFFVETEQITDSTVTVVGENAHHISRSLRMASGEIITVCDGKGTDYTCRLTNFTDTCVTAEILSQKPSEAEPPYHIKVFQALPKGDKLDEIIQKTVECGACEIIPFESSRCIVRLGDGKKDRERTERRQKIAFASAGQCGRGVIPLVKPAVTFENAIGEASKCDLSIFCYEDGTEPLGEILRSIPEMPKSVSVVVGSEGGFTRDEANLAENAGFRIVSLGKRILRTETAATFVLACLAEEFELKNR